MEQKTPRLYPSAPSENNNLEQRLEKKLSEVNISNNSSNNIKEIVSFFEKKNSKWERKYKKDEMLTTTLKSFHTTYVIIIRLSLQHRVLLLCRFNSDTYYP